MVEQESIDFKEWQIDNKNSIFKGNKPLCTFDFETWADANKPATFAMMIVEKVSVMKETITGGTFKLDADGKRLTDPRSGRYLYTVDKSTWKSVWNRCEKHLKTKRAKTMVDCEDCCKEAVKPKSIGKLKTEAVSSRVVITRFWCWADELTQYAVPLLMEKGVETAYAHNLTFDLVAFLTAQEPDLGHPLEYFVQDPNDRSRILFGGSKVMTATIDCAPYFNKQFDTTYSRRVYDYNEKKYVIKQDYPLEFRDSVKLLPLALSKIGEFVGFAKGTTPKIFTDKTDPNHGNYFAIDGDMIDYNIQDCEVLFRGLQSFFINVKSIGYHSQDLPLTSGTLGAQMIAKANVDSGHDPLFRKKKKSWKYESIVNNPEIDDICRKSMVGGRTQVWDRTEQVGKRMFGVDAASHYPSQMTDENNTYPDFRNMATVSDLSKMNGKLESILDTHEGCMYVNWKRPESDKIGLFCHQETKVNGAGKTVNVGGLDWTKEEGTRWITFPEYRKALSVGYEMDIQMDDGICAVIMKRLEYNPFQCVKDWYNLRKEMKANNDPNEFVIKILLNAGGFGKFVERNQSSVICEEQDIPMGFRFSPVQGDDDYMYGYALETDEDGEDLFQRADGTANIIGAYITSYARIGLYEVGVEIGFEHLLYCDTDSWKHTNADMICPKQGTSLGSWALEQEYDYWHSVAPKQYKYHAIEDDGIKCDTWKARIKGCNLNGQVMQKVDLVGEQAFNMIAGLKTSWRSDLQQAGEWFVQRKMVIPKWLREERAQEKMEMIQ